MYKLNDVKMAIEEFLKDHGLQAVRYTQGQRNPYVPLGSRLTARFTIDTIFDDEDNATLLFSSTIATHKVKDQSDEGAYLLPHTLHGSLERAPEISIHENASGYHSSIRCAGIRQVDDFLPRTEAERRGR